MFINLQDKSEIRGGIKVDVVQVHSTLIKQNKGRNSSGESEVRQVEEFKNISQTFLTKQRRTGTAGISLTTKP